MSPTDRYHRITQIVDEAYTAYEDGLVALRKRVVEDMRRKVKESGVLDRSHVAPSLPRERATPEVQHRRARGRRRRRS